MGKTQDLQALSILLLWLGILIGGDLAAVQIQSDEPAPVSCNADEYLCKRPPMCLPIEELCSDSNECTDYEAILDNCPFQCQPHKWECLNVSQCIEMKHICDGSKDCEDGSDELRCDDEKYKCEEEPDSFLCEDRSDCIFAVDVCDGHQMCDDGSDEKNDCYTKCKEKNCGPNQFCLPAGRGVKCVCKDGYEFDSSKNCVARSYCNASDIDRPCSQMCIEGRFGRGPQCHCIAGYHLNKDGISCSATGSQGYLYIATASSIIRMTAEGNYSSSIASNLKGVTGIALDTIQRRIFWGEIGSNGGQSEVFVMDIEGGPKTKTVVASFILQKPEGLAFDFITKNLYIVDSGIPAILVCELNQLQCITVFNNTVVDLPKDIVVNPADGLLYYTETGSKPAIMRGSMDGSSFEALVSINIHHPSSLFLDFTTRRLYWINSLYFSGAVFHVDLDGTNKKVLMSHKISHPSLLSIFEDTIYWVDDETNRILKANKFTGSGARFIDESSSERKVALAVEHKSLQDDHVINRCHSKRCHLCLLDRQESGTCFCTHGYQASFTQQYCEKIEAPSFLLASEKSQILQFPLNTTGRPIISTLKTSGMSDVNRLAFLPKAHNIVYSTTTAIRLMRGIDDGAPQSVDIVGNVTGLIDLAVAETSSLIFWTDSGKDSIQVASLYAEYNTSLPINTTGASALCVDGPRGILYFSELKTSTQIASIKLCRLDGRSCSRLVSKRIQTPNHLVADGQQLYWSDSGLGEIQTIDRWGNDRSTIIVTNGNPLSFTLDQGVLYWIEDGESRIFYKHVHKPGRHEGFIETGGNSLQDLIAVIPHVFQQSACTNDNGGCEQICISINRGAMASCMCSEGFRLHKDRKHCVYVNPDCQEGFSCEWGRLCLARSRVCDGIVDCPDGTDEQLCLKTVVCPAGDFQCSDGHCVDGQYKCDGFADCDDESDEMLQICPKECDLDEHTCGDGQCINKMYVCDIHHDCKDGSDEPAMCDKTCDQFSCGSDQCIPLKWVCDGETDCDDSKDEESCDQEVTCGEHEFQCGNGDCIDKLHVCDIFDHCLDGEDEMNCSGEACSEAEFRCFDGECIHRTATCDGHHDCMLGEDELGCRGVCADEEFQCGNDECIPVGLMCDLKNDCVDGSDEFDCNLSCKNFHQCSQMCVDSLSGPRCACKPGYLLKADGLACEDIDECIIDNGGCSQTCVNVKGHSIFGFGFVCQCLHGFQHTDEYSCKVQGDAPEFFFSDLFGVEYAGRRSHQSYSPVIMLMNVTVNKFEIYDQKNFVFFSTLSGELYQAILFSHNSTRQLIFTSNRIVSLQLDWITGNLYLLHVDNEHDAPEILVLNNLENNDNDSNTVLFHPLYSLSKGSGDLVLHPPKGCMFYVVQWNLQHHIEKASMDGTRREVMSLASGSDSSRMGIISALTIDISTNRLYWVLSPPGHIKSMTIDNTDLLTYNFQVNSHLSSPFLAVFEGRVYFADQEAIFSLPLHKGYDQGRKTLLKAPRPRDIEILHPLIQQRVPNPCRRKKCMYMCLLSDDGAASCVCPQGYRIPPNNRFCEGRSASLAEMRGEAGGSRVDARRTTLPPTTSREKLIHNRPTHLRPTTPRNNHEEEQTTNKTTYKVISDFKESVLPTRKEPAVHKKPLINENASHREPTTNKTPTTKKTAKHKTVEKIIPSHRESPSPNKATSRQKPTTRGNGLPAVTSDTTTTAHLFFIPKCAVSCLNGGTCVDEGDTQSCRCLDEFEGPFCGKKKEQKKLGKEGEEEEESLGWVAGLVIGVALVLFLIAFGVWYYRYRRHNQNLASSIRFQKQTKFVICSQEDKQGLVPEISFGNPGFQEEIDEEAHLHEDQDWWKKLLSRSKRTVGQDFHGKPHHSADRDAMDGCLRGDPQDPATSDKVRLLK